MKAEILSTPFGLACVLVLRNYLGVSIWMSLFPGLAVMITVLGFNILGDGLRDLLDPRK